MECSAVVASTGGEVLPVTEVSLKTRRGAPRVRCPSGCHGCAGFLGRAASLFCALVGLGPGPALLVVRGPDPVELQ